LTPYEKIVARTLNFGNASTKYCEMEFH